MPGPQGETLEDENPFEAFDQAKGGTAAKENAEAALIWAQKYKVFESGVAKELLELWSRQVRLQRIAPSANASELAYANGVREFVESIHAQIEFANNGGRPAYRQR